MIGSGTFDELSTSGVDFSTLLKREEEKKEKTYDSPHPHDHHHNTLRQHSVTSSTHSGDHHHTTLRQHSVTSSSHSRTKLDSISSHHSVNEKGSLMSLASIGTEFEVKFSIASDKVLFFNRKRIEIFIPRLSRFGGYRDRPGVRLSVHPSIDAFLYTP